MSTIRKTQSWRASVYVLFFLVSSQLVLAVALPSSMVYLYRMDYSVIKDNLATVGATLDIVRREIKRKGFEDYVILLGDSITYSGPGGPFQSISFYMDEEASRRGLPPVFNFAIPAAQMGDFYTLLLMLDEREISTKHVILNLTYAGFVKRDPDPPIVYWLERDLQRLDHDVYGEVAEDLARSQENKNRPGRFEAFLEYEVYPRIPILKYRDFIRASIERLLGARSRETGDPRPWFEKEYLREALKAPVYQRQFDPSPVILDDSNPNVFFLKRIVEHQRGKDLVIYMSPVNKALMREETQAPGFIRNMGAINTSMADMAQRYSFTYVDLTDAIPYELFSDHLHLVADGYRLLAGILWQELVTNGNLAGEMKKASPQGLVQRSRDVIGSEVEPKAVNLKGGA